MKSVTIERLEDRRLLSVSVSINFQPAGSPVPAGYLVDSGQVFGDRGNGFSYGWNVNNTATTRDKNSSLSADQRYDTLIHLQKAPISHAVWEIALPNDTYEVRLVSGDAQYFDSVFRTDVEGVLAVNATPTSGNRWAEGTVTVVVADGRLTIQSASGAMNNKLNFVEIKSVTSEADPDPDPDPDPPTFATARINFQPAGATVPAGYLVDSGQVFGNRGNGLSYGWNVNNSATTRDKNSSLSLDQRYDTLIHLQKAPITDAVWEIAVPDGTYRVRLVSGDAQYFDSVFRTSVEGVLAINATPTSANRWAEGTVTVLVTDGRLTIQSAGGAVNNKLNFVEIEQVTANPDPDPDPDPDPTPTDFIPARVNFQPAGATVPVGYLADTGLVFGDRGNGYSYGWNASNTAQTRDKNSSLSLDQRYDTLTHLQKPGNPNAVWEMAVPNGTYWVRVVAGDAANFDSVFRIDVEGTLAVNATPTSGDRWAEGNVLVTVTDGRLTVKSAAGAQNNKLSFIEIIPAAADRQQLLAQIDKTIAWAQTQMAASLASINNNPNVYFERTRDDGTWQTRGASHWTSGFTSGIMWQIYYNTGNTVWKDRATQWALPIAPQASNDDDPYFRMWPAFKPLLDETGNSQYRQVLLAAADEKMSHWNATVGAFETSWFDSDLPNGNFSILTDQIADLQLLYWAADQTGNQLYAQRAAQHLEKMIQYSLRADGSFAQFSIFNRNTGQFVGHDNYSGYGVNSAWSRAQAWALMSLPEIAAASGRQDFLNLSVTFADWYLGQLPADGVPYWDFSDPAAPNTHRDSSAGAIAAVGLLKLADVLGETGPGAKYLAAAERILTSLTSAAYLTEGTPHRGIITHGVALKTRIPESNDASLSFGDYYLLEAITRYKALI